MSDDEFKKKEAAYLSAKAHVKEAEASLARCVERIKHFAAHLSDHGWQSLRLTNHVTPLPASAPMADENTTISLDALPTHEQIRNLLSVQEATLAAQRAAWNELPVLLREALARVCREASRSHKTDRRIPKPHPRSDR